jgi:MFS family permease
MSLAAAIPAARLDELRRRSTWSLVVGVAFGSTGHIAAVTVAAIVAQHLGGSALWSGVAGATVVLGAAGGAVTLSAIMTRRGRRIGLATGYAVGVGGAVVATVAVIGVSLPLLLLGTFFIGFGNASNQLSRYAAADMYPDSRRASAIGLVVWGATAGAIIGPNLVAPAGAFAVQMGLPELAGPYFVPMIFVGAAAILSWTLLRPDPYDLAVDTARPHPDAPDASIAVSLGSVMARPHVPVAMVALVTGQVVMVLIMTMTPLHMTEHGHTLGAVGLVISGHTFGMYGLSPLSGRLTDRFGSVPVILTGLATLAIAAVMAATAPPEGGAWLFLALFLLGYGWNLGYVAGSALLTTGLSIVERTRLQGATDALIWSSAAAASLTSGVIMAAAGFAVLGLIGAAMIAVPVTLMLARRSLVIASSSA